MCHESHITHIPNPIIMLINTINESHHLTFTLRQRHYLCTNRTLCTLSYTDCNVLITRCKSILTVYRSTLLIIFRFYIL